MKNSFYKKLLCLGALFIFMNPFAMANPPVARIEEGGQAAEMANFVISGDVSVFLPALPGTESIALYRVSDHPRAVFSLKTHRQGITITPDGRLAVGSAASAGEIVLEAEVEGGQRIQKSVRLEIPHTGMDLIDPESVPEIKLPAYLPEAETYPMWRCALLALSCLTFAIYIYGRYLDRKALSAGK
jgi:hypothetical protein